MAPFDLFRNIFLNIKSYTLLFMRKNIVPKKIPYLNYSAHFCCGSPVSQGQSASLQIGSDTVRNPVISDG